MKYQRTNLIFDEGDLLRDTVHHELKFELQILTCEDRVIVLFHIGSIAFSLCLSNSVQCL